MWVLVGLSLRLAGLTSAGDCPLREGAEVEMDARVEGAGLHRAWTLYTKISAQQRLLDCRVMYKAELPAGAFLDLEAHKSLHASEPILQSLPQDVESPSQLAKPNTAFVCSRRTIVNSFIFEENLTLPLNLRYPPVSSDGSSGSVWLVRPEVYLRCNSGELSRRRCEGWTAELTCDCRTTEPCTYLPLKDSPASGSVCLARPEVYLRCNSGELSRRRCEGWTAELTCDCRTTEPCTYLPLKDSPASGSVCLARPEVYLRCNSGELSRRRCEGWTAELTCDCRTTEPCTYLPLKDSPASGSVCLARPEVYLRCNNGELSRRRCEGWTAELTCDCRTTEPCTYPPLKDSPASGSVCLARPEVYLRCNSGELSRRRCEGWTAELTCDCRTTEPCTYLPLKDSPASGSVCLARPEVYLRCNNGELSRRRCEGWTAELTCDCRTTEPCTYLPLKDSPASGSVCLARPEVYLRCNSGELSRRRCEGWTAELTCDCRTTEPCTYLPLKDSPASGSVCLARPEVYLRCNNGELSRRRCEGWTAELTCDCRTTEPCTYLPLKDSPASGSVCLARPEVYLRCNSGELSRRRCEGWTAELTCDCRTTEPCTYLPLKDSPASGSVCLARPEVYLRCNSGELSRRRCEGWTAELTCDCRTTEPCTYLPLKDSPASGSGCKPRPEVYLRCNNGELSRRRCEGWTAELTCDCRTTEPCTYLPLKDSPASGSVCLARPEVYLRCNSGELSRRRCEGWTAEFTCDCRTTALPHYYIPSAFDSPASGLLSFSYRLSLLSALNVFVVICQVF